MVTELLAPAQNLQIAKFAISYGADAVYIGAQSFGARKAASNSLFDIEELVNFAHKYNVKIYVTLNTILDNKEILAAQKLVYDLYNIGVDALIIQDMGLLELDLPKIELHASTQCNIRTLEKVKFFEKIGIKRAILARELSLSQIKEISKNTNIELETFIHGALCVSYSGQCYMSASVGGRSANRGECAQACRKKYTLLNSNNKILKEGHLLSLKDFCAEKYLDELVGAGVKSFKIEGRLKDETYVKNVVLYYRRLFDKFEKTSDGKIISDFTPDINKTFNRGYTTYFLSGKRDNIHNFNTPKSMGEYIGQVSYCKGNLIELNCDKKISPQDGLCFFKDGELTGCLVNKVENKKIFLNQKLNLKKGDKIYRNKDIVFENTVKTSKTKRVIEVDVTIGENNISASDKNNEVNLSFLSDFAKNPDKMKENFIKSFKKSGESIFFAKNIYFSSEKLPFLPVAKINELRRELFSKLEDIRIKNYKRNEFDKIKYTKYDDFPKDYRLNIYNSHAVDFYKKCGIEKIEFAPEKTEKYEKIELMRTKFCIKDALNMCPKCGGKNEELFLTDEFGKKYSLTFDCKNCEMIITT